MARKGLDPNNGTRRPCTRLWKPSRLSFLFPLQLWFSKADKPLVLVVSPCERLWRTGILGTKRLIGLALSGLLDL